MFIRTELFKKLGGFDKRYFMYFEDSDLTRSVNLESRTVYCPEATVYHEWGRESKKNFKLKLVQINSMLNYFAKWGLKL
jgi:GT2 family glycosyltransferase